MINYVCMAPLLPYLMMAITDSFLLYGSEVWADVLKVDCRLRILSSVQRTAALIVSSEYRTVS